MNKREQQRIKRPRLVKCRGTYYDVWKCSSCNKAVDFLIPPKFCPHCGKRLEGNL